MNDIINKHILSMLLYKREIQKRKTNLFLQNKCVNSVRENLFM